MAKRKIFIICMAAVVAGSLQSCLKEKECPPSYGEGKLYIAVAEKNYANVGEIEQAVPVDEGLAFRSYVGQIDIRYRPVGGTSGALVRRTLVPAENESVMAVPAEAFTPGRYEITAAGNTAVENLPETGGSRLERLSAADETSSRTGGFQLELHPAGDESNDVYLMRDEAVFPLGEDRTLSMKRTKGLVLLYYKSLPPEISKVALLADGVSKNVDGGLNYSGTVSVAKEFPLPAAATGPGVVTMRLAPTAGSSNPNLTIRLFDGAGNIVRSFSNIALPVARNRITALELRYADDGVWEIWMYAEGVWVQLHNLVLD